MIGFVRYHSSNNVAARGWLNLFSRIHSRVLVVFVSSTPQYKYGHMHVREIEHKDSYSVMLV